MVAANCNSSANKMAQKLNVQQRVASTDAERWYGT